MNQITSGTGLRINGSIVIVTEYQHVKPGKGGAFMRVKLKNIKTQQVLEKTFKSSDKLEDVALEERKLQLLYQSGDSFHFMDTTSFEQMDISKNVIGDDVRFLKENQEVTGICYNDEVLKINLPIFVTAEITHTEPGFRGDTSKAGNKPATVDTSTVIQVPLFINVGDKIKIDTRTGEYVERVKA